MATSSSVVEFQIISSQTNHNLDLFKQKMEKEDKGLSGVGWSNFFDVRQLGQIYIKHLKDCSVVGYPKVPSSNA